MKTSSIIAKLLPGIVLAGTAWPANSMAGDATNVVGWSTNGPAVSALVRVEVTNAAPNAQSPIAPKPDESPAVPDSPAWRTNRIFDHFLPGSLNNLVWTNFIAHTNHADMTIWSVRSHPPDWPAHPPAVVWNTNSLIWAMKGITALSPCWEVESGPGQVAATALTRRHAYVRGHGMGPDGFNTNCAGRKVWFITTNNTVVEATVKRDVVRSFPGGAQRDYTILLLSDDLPGGIDPLRVVAPTNLFAKYQQLAGLYPIFKTEQTGRVSTEVPPLIVNTWKGGDSGSPDMLPMPNELVFINGRSTSGASPQMQADMDELCRMEQLDPKQYQLQWVDLSGFPSY